MSYTEVGLVKCMCTYIGKLTIIIQFTLMLNSYRTPNLGKNDPTVVKWDAVKRISGSTRMCSSPLAVLPSLDPKLAARSSQ